eukprot:scpid85433/ scgid35708/ 
MEHSAAWIQTEQSRDHGGRVRFGCSHVTRLGPGSEDTEHCPCQRYMRLSTGYSCAVCGHGDQEHSTLCTAGCLPSLECRHTLAHHAHLQHRTLHSTDTVPTTAVASITVNVPVAVATTATPLQPQAPVSLPSPTRTRTHARGDDYRRACGTTVAMDSVDAASGPWQRSDDRASQTHAGVLETEPACMHTEKATGPKQYGIALVVIDDSSDDDDNGSGHDVIGSGHDLNGSEHDDDGSGHDDDGSGHDDDGSGHDDDGSGHDDDGSGHDDDGSG